MVDIHMFADGLEVGQYFAILSVGNGILAGDDECQGKGVGVCNSIFRRNDTLPDSQGLEHLELLGEEESDPPEAVVEWIDFEGLESIPCLGLEHLHS